MNKKMKEKDVRNGKLLIITKKIKNPPSKKKSFWQNEKEISSQEKNMITSTAQLIIKKMNDCFCIYTLCFYCYCSIFNFKHF